MLFTRRTVLATAPALLATRAFSCVAALGEDAAILQDAFQTLHPGLHRYASSQELAALLSAFDAAADAPLPARFLALSRYAGAIRCGHTHCNPLNQSDAVAAALFEGPMRLPFRFRWVGAQMVVTDGQSSGLPRGTQVLAVNDVAAAHILRRLLPYARADGGNDAKRLRIMSVEGNERIEAFDIFHPLLFPFAGDQVRVEVRMPNGRRDARNLPCLSLAERQAAMAGGAEPPAGNPGWTLSVTGRTAVMTMPSWALYESDWDWRGWIGQGFERLERAGCTALVIDLRANEGGNDCGDAVLAHMIEAPLATPRYERRVRYREAPARLRPYLRTWDRSFDYLGRDAVPIGGGFYRLPPASDNNLIAPLRPRFRGRLIVLVGPECSSATFQFASRVREQRLGTLVGETTGGNRRGINGGGFYFLRLPRSGLEIDLPLIGTFPPTSQPDAGIVPDMVVAETAADIAAGRDSALAAALELARAA